MSEELPGKPGGYTYWEEATEMSPEDWMRLLEHLKAHPWPVASISAIRTKPSTTHWLSKSPEDPKKPL
jgi:hypothetical protein